MQLRKSARASVNAMNEESTMNYPSSLIADTVAVADDPEPLLHQASMAVSEWQGIIFDELRGHFMSSCGGSQSELMTQGIAQQAAKFLAFAAAEVNNSKYQVTSGAQFRCALKDLVENDHAAITRYFKYLADMRCYKLATLKAYTSRFALLFRWLLLHSGEQVDQHGYNKMSDVMSNMSRNFGKSLRRENNTADNNIENLVANRKWIPGGVDQIKNKLNDLKAWASTVGAAPGPIELSQYNDFVAYLLVHLLTYAPQGRIGGIQSCTKANGLELLDSGEHDVMSACGQHFVLFYARLSCRLHRCIIVQDFCYVRFAGHHYRRCHRAIPAPVYGSNRGQVFPELAGL